MFHSRGSTAVITSLMLLVPLRAASMFDWMLRSQIPVRFDGACTSAPGSGARLGGVDVGVVAGTPRPAGGGGPAGPEGRAGGRLCGVLGGRPHRARPAGRPR